MESVLGGGLGGLGGGAAGGAVGDFGGELPTGTNDLTPVSPDQASVTTPSL